MLNLINFVYLDLTQQTFVLMKTSWRCLEDVFHLRLQKTSSRYIRLQDSPLIFAKIHSSSRFAFNIRQDTFVFKMYSPYSLVLRRRLIGLGQDVFNPSSRRFQDVLEDVKLLRWRRVKDVFKTNKCLLGIFSILDM